MEVLEKDCRKGGGWCKSKMALGWVEVLEKDCGL